MIEVGTQAPTFTLPNQDGDEVALADFKGQTVVVYFYPKADTPGCTTQACGVRDASAEYAERGVSVIGISPDPVAKVKKFHEKQSLNFTLLADEDHAVCEQFGTWVEKSMYGRTYWGSTRTTFIVDEAGVIRHVIPKASPSKHDADVLAALDALSASSKS